jgi:hypothetical protein
MGRLPSCYFDSVVITLIFLAFNCGQPQASTLAVGAAVGVNLVARRRPNARLEMRLFQWFNGRRQAMQGSGAEPG